MAMFNDPSVGAVILESAKALVSANATRRDLKLREQAQKHQFQQDAQLLDTKKQNIELTTQNLELQRQNSARAAELHEGALAQQAADFDLTRARTQKALSGPQSGGLSLDQLSRSADRYTEIKVAEAIEKVASLEDISLPAGTTLGSIKKEILNLQDLNSKASQLGMQAALGAGQSYVPGQEVQANTARIQSLNKLLTNPHVKEAELKGRVRRASVDDLPAWRTALEMPGAPDNVVHTAANRAMDANVEREMTNPLAGLENLTSQAIATWRETKDPSSFAHMLRSQYPNGVSDPNVQWSLGQSLISLGMEGTEAQAFLRDTLHKMGSK
jgi:hypothetical protein